MDGRTYLTDSHSEDVVYLDMEEFRRLFKNGENEEEGELFEGIILEGNVEIVYKAGKTFHLRENGKAKVDFVNKTVTTEHNYLKDGQPAFERVKIKFKVFPNVNHRYKGTIQRNIVGAEYDPKGTIRLLLEGFKIFLPLDKNGKITDVWDLAACRNFGDTEPKYRGNINTMFSWQDLTMNLSFAYQWGGQQYNKTLLNKVEIVESEIKNNVDNRVFSDRWQKPGDVKPFKAYSDERTKASSRFVMDDNVFQLQAISIQYRWRSKFLQQHLRLQSLDFNLNLSDVFYISSIKRERGTTYPFSRKVNFSVALMF